MSFFCPVFCSACSTSFRFAFSPPLFVSSLVSAGSRVAKRAAGPSAGPLAKMPRLIPLASSSVSAGAVKTASAPLVAR